MAGFSYVIYGTRRALTLQRGIRSSQNRWTGTGCTDDPTGKISQSDGIRLIKRKLRVIKVVNSEVNLRGTAWDGQVDILYVSAYG